MSQMRWTVGLVAAVMLAGSAAAVAAPVNDCTQSREFEKVKAACKEGGRKAAKRVMKAAVRRARAQGTKLKCKGCHENLNSWALKADAVSMLRPWMQ